MQSTQSKQIDLGQAFKFILDDPQWVSKTLIGAVFALLSVFILPIFVVYGYYAKLITNVANGDPRPLPEWSNFGELFMDGLKVGLKIIAVFLVYALPSIILQIIGQVLITAGASEDSGMGPGAIIGIPLVIASGLMYFVIGFLSPLLQVYAIRGPLSEAFNFPQLLVEARANLGNLLLVFVGLIGAGFVANLGFMVCCVGVVWTLFLAQLVNGHLIGQLWAILDNRSNTGGFYPQTNNQPVNPFGPGDIR